MYVVSDDYKSQIEKQLRNQSHMRIRFGITDPQAKDDAVISDTSSLIYSNSSLTKIESNVTRTYDTLEHNKFILDEIHLLADSNYSLYQGYVSSTMTNENCAFTSPPQVIINYSSYYEFAGFSFTFDNTRNEFASEIRVQCFLDGAVVFNQLHYPANYDYTLETPIPLHNKMVVTFLKTSLPYKRVRLHYLSFGIVRNLTESTITNTNLNRSLDILSTVLPKGDFDFTFIDINNEYNPENPSGLYAYLEQLQPVKFEYGYELDDGSIEWVLGGNNYTTGDVTISSSGRISNVTFKTSNSLAYLSDIYQRGSYNAVPKSLYDLAVDTMVGTNVLYEFADELKTIFTTAPLPKIPIRECLQLIANASRCILDVSRDGIVRIYRFVTYTPLSDINNVLLTDTSNEQLYGENGSGVKDFKYDSSNSYDIPTVKKVPPLKNLYTSYYNYTPESTTSTLNEIDVTALVNTTYYFEYEMASNVVLNAGSGVSIIGTPIYYAEGCVATLSGVGKVTITGKKIVKSENNIVLNYNPTGEDCTVKNNLLVNLQDCQSYGEWFAGVLLLKNTYEFENRGYPEVDCGDKLFLDTLYTNNLETIVIEDKLVYNGALRSSTKLLISE
jgi:hypothetical protein